MKLFLLKLMMVISSSSLFMKTPMSMGIMLFIQTMMTTMLISKNMSSSWISMIIFIMFIGGLLILFMYMSSVACNEKFKVNLKFLIIFLIMLLPIEEMMMETQLDENQKFFLMNECVVFSKIYSSHGNFITIMMFIYMFITMVVVTKIVKIHMGPLRSFLMK